MNAFTKKRLGIIAVIAAVCVLLAVLVAANSSVIFQRGNPVPYLLAATKISNTGYAEVEVSGCETVYITRRGNSDELFEYLCETTGCELTDRAGSGYFFAGDGESFTVEAEVYLSQFTVWTIAEV